jgi:MFS family permease
MTLGAVAPLIGDRHGRKDADPVMSGRAARVKPAPEGRDLRLFLGASLLSFLGDGVRYAALPLYAAKHGAGPSDLGLLLGFATLPFLLLGVFGGVLADRTRRRSLLISCDVIRLGITAAFTVAVATGQASLPVVFAMAFLMGLLETVATSATFAFIPMLAAPGELTRANGAFSTALLIGRQFVGPLIGAVLVDGSPSLPFALDGCTFLLSSIMLIAIATGRERKPAPGRIGPAAVFQDIRDSARWMRSAPSILLIACSAGALNLFTMGALAIQPAYAQHILGGPDIAYGAMMASTALGGVVGAQGANLYSTRLSRGGAIAWSLVLMGGGYLAVAAAPHPLMAYAGLFVAGIGLSLWSVVTTTWRQRVAPAALHGRADALHRAISWGVNPVGSVMGGLLASHFGYRLPFLLVGVAPLLICPLFLRRRDGLGHPDGTGTVEERPSPVSR